MPPLQDPLRITATTLAMPTTSDSGFFRLVADQQGPLLNSAKRFTRNVHDAEDLVQEVLLRAMRFADKFRRGTNLRAWLNRILHNTAINRFRSAKRTPKIATSLGEELALGEAPARAESRQVADPLEVETYAEQLSDELRDALDRIPGHYRDVFLLSALGEYRHKEIAEKLGIAEGTVMSRLFRARKLLKGELDKVA